MPATAQGAGDCQSQAALHEEDEHCCQTAVDVVCDVFIGVLGVLGVIAIVYGIVILLSYLPENENYFVIYCVLLYLIGT